MWILLILLQTFLRFAEIVLFLDLHISESVFKHNHFAASTAGHFICCEARVLAKDLEGCFCLAKLASFSKKFFHCTLIHRIYTRDQNRTVMRGPFGHQSWDTTQWGRGGKGQDIFTAAKCVRPNLALSALTPDQGVWARKEQRHPRQIDTSHYCSMRNLGMLTGSCAPAKKSGQELGNQSLLTCRQ